MLLDTAYNPVLVQLSVAVATFAAYTAVTLISRIGDIERRRQYRLWLATSGSAMGLGVWSMHFVARLAFSIPVPVSYHAPTRFASLLIAVLACVSGVAGMHYTAMWAASFLPSGAMEAPIAGVVLDAPVMGTAVAVASGALMALAL